MVKGYTNFDGSVVANIQVILSIKKVYCNISENTPSFLVKIESRADCIDVLSSCASSIRITVFLVGIPKLPLFKAYSPEF